MAVAELLDAPHGQPAVGFEVDPEIDWDLYKYFDPVTDPMLACPCCGVIKYAPRLLGMVVATREMAGFPFIVNSGYRCRQHDMELHKLKKGYAGTSSHVDGEAMDIAVHSNNERYRLVRAALYVGFCRIGLGANFVHLDICRTKAQNIVWTYKADPGIKAMAVRYASLRYILCRNMATSITVGRNSMCYNSDVITPELVLI